MARLISATTWPILFLILGALAQNITERNCPAERPVGLCCVSLEPFSGNAYVWENVCGFPAPANPSTDLVAGFCEGPGTCNFDGIIPVCCEETRTCQSGVDGPTGLNCIRVSESSTG